ncbi:MAG: hypothetical protein ACE5GM_03915 [bacterium]
MLKKEQYKYIFFAAVLGTVVFYLGNINRKKHLVSSGSCQTTVYRKGAVSVNRVFKSPDAFRHNFKVQGVVGPVFPDKYIFFLNDLGSGPGCGSCGKSAGSKSGKSCCQARKGAKGTGCKSGKGAGCRGGQLPVKYSGRLPSAGDIVIATGRIINDARGKQLVRAVKVQKLGKTCCQHKLHGKGAAYSVKTIAAAPFSFKERIRVKGIVKGIYPEKSMFGLADCQEKGSGGALIPVKYSGSFPQDRQCVIITGTIKSTEEGKLFLAASGIKVVASPKCKPVRQRI